METMTEKWATWFDAVTSHVVYARVKRHAFFRFRSICDANPALHKPSYFYDFSSDNYVWAITMCLRREIKSSEKSISFARLLSELAAHPGETTRTKFVGRMPARAHALFDEFANADSTQLDGGRVAADLARLRAASARAEEYADKVVAHFDKKQPTEMPTLEDLHSALDVLFALHGKYHRLFRGAEFVLDEAEYLGTSWLDIFRFAWLPA